MWTLFEAYYADVGRETFERDLSNKDHVILLHDAADGSLQGFSTLRQLRLSVQGRPLLAVFSGDTIVDQRYWGQTALQRAFLRYVIGCKLRHPWLPVYWYLITKGYKTYLLLARNFPEHWPRYDRPTPPWQSEVLDRLARELFPDTWRPEAGVLAHAGQGGCLRAEVAPLSAELLQMPQVRFFAQRNPGHAQGDELCTLGRVGADLWVAYMGKLVRRGLSRWWRR